MRKLCAIWVPRFLTIDKKCIRVSISEQNSAYFNRNPKEFLCRFLTMDVKMDRAPKRPKTHELGFESLPHPPYSPDLAPSDCYLFLNLKRWLCGRRFESNKEVKWETEGYQAKRRIHLKIKLSFGKKNKFLFISSRQYQTS